MNPFPGWGKIFDWLADFEYVAFVLFGFIVGFICGLNWSK